MHSTARCQVSSLLPVYPSLTHMGGACSVLRGGNSGKSFLLMKGMARTDLSERHFLPGGGEMRVGMREGIRSGNEGVLPLGVNVPTRIRQ